MPLPLRHDYAADLHRGLPTGDINRPKEFPDPMLSAVENGHETAPSRRSRWGRRRSAGTPRPACVW